MNYIMIGILCISSFTEPDCIFFNEDPIKNYTSFESCQKEAVKKVNEMGPNLKNNGIPVTSIKIYCMLDKSQNT
tara:strand:- start:25179 stop:25400 length:222 start_codon:yes stop_codon:yes gene_type:complete